MKKYEHTTSNNARIGNNIRTLDSNSIHGRNTEGIHMNTENDDRYIEIDTYGKVSKLDKWDYNKTLNILARNALFTMKTPVFGYWVNRFVTALKVVNVKKLPLKKMLIEKDSEIREQEYYNKTDQLQKNNEVWNDYYRRDFYLSLWEEKYWEALFDYSLELATQAGFTIYLESIDESIALRG